MVAGGRGWNAGYPKYPVVKQPGLNPACDRFREHSGKEEDLLAM